MQMVETILDNAPPSLPAKYFSPQFREFISKCLIKDVRIRTTRLIVYEHLVLGSRMSAFLWKFCGVLPGLPCMVQRVSGKSPLQP